MYTNDSEKFFILRCWAKYFALDKKVRSLDNEESYGVNYFYHPVKEAKDSVQKTG